MAVAVKLSKLQKALQNSDLLQRHKVAKPRDVYVYLFQSY